MTTTENVRNELKTLEDPTYREFHSSLIPGADNILGVRIPQLRTMAKEIAKKEDWRTFVEATDTLYYEETMLQGMVIGRAKMEPEERIKYIRLFVPRINNWAVCDIFSGELKTAARKGKETIWQFVQPYLESKEEYQLRFGIVMLFHYVDEEYDEVIRVNFRESNARQSDIRIDPTTVSHFMRGHRNNPTIKTICEIADGANLSVSDLLKTRPIY